MKIALLFAFIGFGVYAQYDAEQTVMNILRDRKQTMTDEGAEATSTAEVRQTRYMNRAIELSHVGHRHGDGAPSGSIIVKDGVIIGEGWNKVKLLNDPSAHAEVIAIRDAGNRTSSTKLEGSVLYTSAQPCSMCLALIYQTGIEKVYYCIPGDRVREIHPDLATERGGGPILSLEESGRVQEIPVMQESVSKLIKSYHTNGNGPNL